MTPKKKRPRGRPPGAEYPETITVRVGLCQSGPWKLAAEKAGMGLNAWVRMVLDDAAGK